MNQASYGETSGFVPVSSDEQMAVNGGHTLPPWWILALIATSGAAVGSVSPGK
jgi:hypothetical protein